MDGLTDAFIVIDELSCLPGIGDRHVQGTLGNIHADIDCFLYHLLSLLLGPSLRDADLINPGNCSGSSGDSGVATTLPHGLARPEVNRPATPIPRRIL